MNFSYWWSCIGKGLSQQSAQQACYEINRLMKVLLSLHTFYCAYSIKHFTFWQRSSYHLPNALIWRPLIMMQFSVVMHKVKFSVISLQFNVQVSDKFRHGQHVKNIVKTLQFMQAWQEAKLRSSVFGLQCTALLSTCFQMSSMSKKLSLLDSIMPILIYLI